MDIFDEKDVKPMLIGADAEAHDGEGKKAEDGGQRAGRDGHTRFDNRRVHGRLDIGAAPPVALIAMEQKDRVVHRDGQLEDGGTGAGDERDAVEEEVGPLIEEDGHPDHHAEEEGL